MTLPLGIVALGVAAALAAATPDAATIVNSGSTNFTGYTIEVHSDGTATAATSNRGTATSTPKPFTLEASAAKQFFTDLAAARKDGAAIQPCMKSASFGSTTRVTWQDWTSPDLSCPPANPSAAALRHDIDTIVQTSGVTPGPRRLVPIAPQPEPSPKPS